MNKNKKILSFRKMKIKLIKTKDKINFKKKNKNIKKLYRFLKSSKK